jgi:hypothetical protein
MKDEEIVAALPELEIDSQGRVWRIAMRHGRGVKNGGGYHMGSRMSPCARRRTEAANVQGYLQVHVMVDGRRMSPMAHRVVWVHLNGPIPEGLTINHKNGIKSDNRPENLEIATFSEQRQHALDVLHVKKHHPIGSKHPKTHLTEADVLQIRNLRKSGAMVKDIAAEYGMKPKAVSAICCRRTWKHI